MISKELVNDDYFITSDLSLAAALVAWDFPIIDIDKTDFRKALFTFQNTSELTKNIKAYWDDSKLILPRRYFYSLKELKSRLYA